MIKENYVYARFIKETNECFYIGTGKGNRYKSLKRNKMHDDFIKTHEFYTVILHNNLSYEESIYLEYRLKQEYKELGHRITNQLEEMEFGVCLKGEKNPMFGRTWWDEDTPKEKIEQWKINLSNSRKGSLNVMYGKTHKKETLIKISQANTGRNVKKSSNENYKGGKNSQSKKVEVYINGKMYPFDCVVDSFNFIRKDLKLINKRGVVSTKILKRILREQETLITKKGDVLTITYTS